MNYIIKNGNVYTGESHIENCDILVSNGKIEKVGTSLDAPTSYTVIDATDKYVTPGLIDAHCHVGMWETAIGFEGADGNEMTDPVTPQLRSIDAFNPMDESFDNAIVGGVTTIATGPGSANVIGGQYTCIKTYGNIADQMILKEVIGMKCAFGENPKRLYGTKDKSPQTRMAIAAKLREELFAAKNYLEKKEAAIKEGKPTEFNFKHEAMIPVLKGEIPLKAHCHRADDISTAIRIAKEFGVKLSLDHVTEGHLIADYIKEQNVPCIVGPSFGEKSKFELKEKSFITAKVLFDKGIQTAIMTDSPVIPIKELGMCVGFVINEGLSFENGLKTVTINPARILGVDDRVGSIEQGKDADIVVWNKKPFTLAAYASITMINGEIVYKENAKA